MPYKMVILSVYIEYYILLIFKVHTSNIPFQFLLYYLQVKFIWLSSEWHFNKTEDFILISLMLLHVLTNVSQNLAKCGVAENGLCQLFVNVAC